MKLALAAVALGAAQAAASDLHHHLGHRAAHHLFSGHRRSSLHGHHLPPEKVDAVPSMFSRDAAPLNASDVVHEPVKKRAVCALPDDASLVSVPGASNGGWAMAPDTECTAGSWCPFACVSGKVMAQWKPGTTYTYPESMDGGLYCDDDGTPQKSFDDQPYCVEGTGTVSVVNNCGSVVSFCQTVLPGDEGMYIPTDVESSAVLAVPDESYWDSTAAHYYINPPGTSGSTGCVWGTEAEPIGNWSPYVAGANTVSSGDTYLKIGWNPIFISSALADTKPSFGIKVECAGSGCNGLPCQITSDDLASFSVTSDESSTGAGGADFCVVTVPSGGSANIVVYNFDGSTSGGSSSSSSVASLSVASLSAASSSAASSSSVVESSTSSSTEPTSTSSSSSVVTTSSTSSTLSTSSTVSSTSSSSSSSIVSSTNFTSTSETSLSTALSTHTKVSVGGIFQENSTATSTVSISRYSTSATVTTAAPSVEATTTEAAAASSTPTNEGAHRQGGAAMVGLLVAVVASLWLC